MRENCFKGQATDWELYLSGFSYSFWVALLAAGAVVYAAFLAYRYAKSNDVKDLKLYLASGKIIVPDPNLSSSPATLLAVTVTLSSQSHHVKKIER